MRYALNALYLLLITLASPWLLYSAVRYGKYRTGLGEKLLGAVPRLPEHPNRIWLHAVSVGEVNLLQPILDRLLVAIPDLDIVITTTTLMGHRLATKKYPDHCVCYCPLDFSWSVKRAFARIQPRLFVLVELELWPNLLAEAARLNIPVAIVNGRLSDQSIRGYRRLAPLMRHWLRGVTAVAAQSKTCATRFIELGVHPSRVKNVGSVKFDGAKTDRSNPLSMELSRKGGLLPDDVVFVAGSTQAPEEEMSICLFEQLGRHHPELRLVIVPRHPERGDEVAALLRKRQLPFIRRSRAEVAVADERPVILVDTIGELAGWWGCSDIGFVGGSMGKRGGQNMIEPAAYGVATSFGPKTRNFRDVVNLLLSHQSAVEVANQQELHDFVERCLLDENYRKQLGQHAHRLVTAQRGAAAKTVEILSTLLHDEVVAFSQQSGSSRVGPGQHDVTQEQGRRRA